MQKVPDIEILVYDDASTDDSVASIRKHFGQQITLIAGQINCGQGVVRNIIINRTKGDYILFLDSDDLLAPGAISALGKSINDNDVVFGMVSSFCHDRTKTYRHDWLNSDLKALKLKPSIYRLAQIPSPWNKLMSVAFLKQRHIRFSEIRSAMDDCLFQYLLAFAKPRYTVIDNVIVNIRQHTESLSTYSNELKVRPVMEVTKELIAACKPQSLGLRTRLYGNNLVHFLIYNQQNPYVLNWVVKNKSILARSNRAIIVLKLLLVSRLSRYLRLL